MKLIIAGPRDMNVHPFFISELLDFYQLRRDLTEIVSGGADGIDMNAIDFAGEYNYDAKTFDADWKTYGDGAGPIRNAQMANYADALLLIHGGDSRGSNSMKEEMLRFGKPVFECLLRRYNFKEKNEIK